MNSGLLIKSAHNFDMQLNRRRDFTGNLISNPLKAENLTSCFAFSSRVQMMIPATIGIPESRSTYKATVNGNEEHIQVADGHELIEDTENQL
ncbi:hypothetical protein M9H77_15903 [Catharanthus roseus]|uniref:Uncharacterized protein n=1 Tax=Catharanthus roseus TaxID=4058 RepID=A0ACC0B095_CATRO|nr:hypothetical protein M9H77_15903 [Catharanthus roseus]